MSFKVMYFEKSFFIKSFFNAYLIIDFKIFSIVFIVFGIMFYINSINVINRVKNKQYDTQKELIDLKKYKDLQYMAQYLNMRLPVTGCIFVFADAIDDIENIEVSKW